MNQWKEMKKEELIPVIVVAAVVVVLILLSALAPVLFPGTTFANIVDSSVGRFFNIADFFANNYVTLLESAAIVFFMWVIEKVLTTIVRLLSRKNARGATIADLLTSILKYASALVAVFMVLGAWGVSTGTLLAGAGIIGLAVSFGAQSLIEDIIAGFFIIFEKQFAVGDIIEVDGFRGTVNSIGIRTTQIEDYNGDVKIMNNSDIRGALNTSANLSPSICDISINYGEDLEKVEKVIRESLPKIRERIPDIVEGPFYRGVQSLADSSVVLRIYAKTAETKKYQVTRDLNRAMKLLFDEHKIGIPFPQVVVHQGKPDE
ncbi:MAG: mechanosensitive ion channel family protein [Candidatus Izemoplasmatales bacterium]